MVPSTVKTYFEVFTTRRFLTYLPKEMNDTQKRHKIMSQHNCLQLA